MSTITAATATQPENHTRSLVLCWAILVGLTLTSWWFKDHGLTPAAAITLILVLTFLKVFMVGNTFMEIGRAPRIMQGIFVAWCSLTCLVLIALALAL